MKKALSVLLQRAGVNVDPTIEILGHWIFTSRPASPGQTNSQVDASQRKFAKPEIAYGLAKVGSQVAKSRKFHARLLAISLCRLALGGQTVKKLASKFELDRSQRKSTRVVASPHSGWQNETQVQNLRRLASPFGQGFKHEARHWSPAQNLRASSKDTPAQLKRSRPFLTMRWSRAFKDPTTKETICEPFLLSLYFMSICLFSSNLLRPLRF